MNDYEQYANAVKDLYASMLTNTDSTGNAGRAILYEIVKAIFELTSNKDKTQENRLFFLSKTSDDIDKKKTTTNKKLSEKLSWS